MKFITIMQSTQDHRAMDGYRFAGKATIDKSVRPDFTENDHEHQIDGFYDGWGDICRGDDGALYCVEFDFGRPYIWAPVEEVSGDDQ